ncbi:RSAD1 [Branchiostoma lanceolatum]|uniref:Radical S-adenosyl methionine domain-containing protein 1, mitochondrial n=1 Tax=Branchiostoma lanceolatum TaxID=7740 RepID=A0A8K0AE78_BRALA|nr:RSAD1 [Branchiostoma lanceolatum]
MRRCLVQETGTLLQQSGVKQVNSVFFGGGTPSLALPHTLEAVLEVISQHALLPADAEVTLEANPSSTETEKLREFKAAGINRLSLGVQAFNPSDLQLLGRDHSVEDSLRALQEGRTLFPGRVSVDLIFGRPRQTVESWQGELKQALSVCDDHVSLYQLTLERGTALFRQVEKKQQTVPDPDTMAELYACARGTLQDAGFRQYEVSNFARNGAESSHNLSYWRGKQYIGVGPGAHGRFASRGVGQTVREARIQTLEPQQWMGQVERLGHATVKRTSLSQLDILEEILMLGLRTTEGLTDERWQQFSGGASLHDIFGTSEAVQGFINAGLLEFSHSVLKVTPSGLAVLDSLVPDLLLATQEFCRGRCDGDFTGLHQTSGRAE